MTSPSLSISDRRSPIVTIGQCMGAFSCAYPDPFLEKKLFGFDLDSLLSELSRATSRDTTTGNVLYVVDVVIPVLARYVCACAYCIAGIFQGVKFS